MSKTDGKVHVRLDSDVLEMLREIQEGCRWPVSYAVLANYILRHGKADAIRTFDWKRGGKAK